MRFGFFSLSCGQAGSFFTLQLFHYVPNRQRRYPHQQPSKYCLFHNNLFETEIAISWPNAFQV